MAHSDRASAIHENTYDEVSCLSLFCFYCAFLERIWSYPAHDSRIPRNIYIVNIIINLARFFSTTPETTAFVPIVHFEIGEIRVFIIEI